MGVTAVFCGSTSYTSSNNTSVAALYILASRHLSRQQAVRSGMNLLCHVRFSTRLRLHATETALNVLIEGACRKYPMEV